MRIVRHASSLPPELQGAVIALGNFDGVHRGHQWVIGTARELACALGAPLGVMTFEPHPRRFFNPGQPPFTLTSFRLKCRLIESQQADFLFVQPFDKTLAQGSAQWFVDDILLGKLGIRHVVVGQDYAFGHAREGSVGTLQSMGRRHGFGVSAVAPVFDQTGSIISSTRIREALSAGEVDLANDLLGHPWEVEGRVEHGEARGRQLGFPTANVRLGDMQAPAIGVYAITAGIDRGLSTDWFPAVANFGRRPTFGPQDPVMEAHLLDFSGDLYGHHLRVRFHHYLREEQTFSGIDALKAQIACDIETARCLLGSVPLPPS